MRKTTVIQTTASSRLKSKSRSLIRASSNSMDSSSLPLSSLFAGQSFIQRMTEDTSTLYWFRGREDSRTIKETGQGMYHAMLSTREGRDSFTSPPSSSLFSSIALSSSLKLSTRDSHD